MMGKVVFVAFVAINVVLSNVDAADHSCGPFKTAGNKCEYTLAKGDKVSFDCTGSNTHVIPTTMFSGSLTSAKVCSDPKGRSDAKADCSSEVTLESLKKKNVTTTSSTTKITITNTDYKESSDLVLSGSCSDNATAADVTKSGYFNVTLKKNDANSAHHLRVVLAVTGMALLGLTAF